MIKTLIRLNKKLGNKGHFLLPALGAVGAAAAKVAAAAGPALAAAAKGVGTAALTGAKALGTGALKVGSMIPKAAQGLMQGGSAIGKGVMNIGSKIGEAAKGMLGIGSKAPSSGTQVATVMGKPVTFGQTAQGAGMNFNPATGALEATKGASKIDWGKALQSIMEGMGGSNEEKKQQQAQAANPGMIGGEGGYPIQMPQFTRPPSAGSLIAAMLQARRGF